MKDASLQNNYEAAQRQREGKYVSSCLHHRQKQTSRWLFLQFCRLRHVRRVCVPAGLSALLHSRLCLAKGGRKFLRWAVERASEHRRGRCWEVGATTFEQQIEPGRDPYIVNLNEEESFLCIPDGYQAKKMCASGFTVELEEDNAAPTHLVSF